MKRVVRRPVIAFTALAYLLFWWPLLVESDISGGIFPFGPTLAAIIVTALVLGRPGLRELWIDRSAVRPGVGGTRSPSPYPSCTRCSP